MQTTEALYSLLDDRRQELGLSQIDVGRLALQQESASVLQNIRRGSWPRLDTLMKVCDALGLKVTVDRPHDFALQEPGREFHHAQAPTEAMIFPPWRWPDGKPLLQPLGIDHGWLVENGVLPARLALVEAESAWHARQSHQIQVAIVDTAATLHGGGLWGYREDGKERVAQLFFINDVVTILPDRISGPVRTIHDLAQAGIELAGRVVWFLQRTQR